MALTLKTDGLGTESKFTHDWVDDYYDLLTGVMHDQEVKLDYRPGGGTAPTLSLKGDGSGPLLRGFKTDNTTEAFKVDSNGNLTLAGTATSATFPLARFRALGTGVTAGVNIWVIPSDGDDPTEADGLQEGDFVFSVVVS